MSDTTVVTAPPPQGKFLGVGSAMWKTIVTWALAPSGVFYKFIAGKLGLPVPDAGDVADLIVQAGPGVAMFIVALARRMEANIVREAAKIMAARGHDTGAAYAAQAAQEMKKPTGTTLLPFAPWAAPWANSLGLAGLALASLTVGACTLTGADGQPVVLNAQTAPGLILAKLQSSCKFYNANADTIRVASTAIQTAIRASQDVQGGVNTVENVAGIACGLLAPPPVLPAAPAVPVVVPAVPAVPAKAG